MAISSELQHPTFPDAPTQVVAEEDQAQGKVEVDQGHPQARDLLAQARKGSVTTPSVENVIGETSASTSTKLDRRRRSLKRLTSPACIGKRANVTKGTSACSGTTVLRVNRVVRPNHQATRSRAQLLLPRMESPGHHLLLLSGDPAGVDLAVRTRHDGRLLYLVCISCTSPTMRQMRVNPKPQVRHIDVEGKGSPHLTTRQRRYAAIYAGSSNCPKPDRRDLTQAIEAAKELEAIVEAPISNVQVPCNFECSDFGLTCQHGEKLYQLSCPAHNAGLEFLADTGSEEDLISRGDHELYYSDAPIESTSKHVSLMTANGSIQGDRSVALSMPMIGLDKGQRVTYWRAPHQFVLLEDVAWTKGSNSTGTLDSPRTSPPQTAGSCKMRGRRLNRTRRRRR